MKWLIAFGIFSVLIFVMMITRPPKKVKAADSSVLSERFRASDGHFVFE